MSKPFPRWSDSVLRAALSLLVAAMAGLGMFVFAWLRSPLHLGTGNPAEQPVPFDHRHHVDDAKIDCLYCHYLARRTPYAGVPGPELCMNCHAQVWRESDVLAPIRRQVAAGAPFIWRRVHQLPDFVFFDHSIHVARGVGCETCHGRVDQMARVYKVVSLNMDWCVDCHRDPTPKLRPIAEVTTMGYAHSQDEGLKLARELHIDAPTHCSGCHR